MEVSQIKVQLQALGFGTAVLDNYRHPHRAYHNEQHLQEVLSFMYANGPVSDLQFLAAVYHDAVYWPRLKNNEQASADLFKSHAAGKLNATAISEVVSMILDTIEHKASSPAADLLLRADLDILNQPLNRLIEYEKGIYKEYQFVPYSTYKAARIIVLEELNTDGNLDALLDYVNTREPLTGVFCGSFNPFHKGHYNVLQKAERIFDKVIIAFGKNPDKQARSWPLPELISNRQIEEYHGLLTDFIATLDQDVVVVRGLRNSTDFQYEQNQYRYIQELMPEIRIVNIFCDKEFEHISSSGIRTLEKFDRHHSYLLE
jgi:pantetheine-phosphate adenylyltransferase